MLTALVGSGLPTDRFYFGGFLPVKAANARELGTALARKSPGLESPHRIVRSLKSSPVSTRTDRFVARELTKVFRNTAAVASTVLRITLHPPKGEITLVIAGVRL